MWLEKLQAANKLLTKIKQIMNRKNTKSLSPTQFSQTQDVPLGKHQQQNTSCKDRLAAERRKCKPRGNSQKISWYTLEINCWGWGLNRGPSRGCSLEVSLSLDSCGRNLSSGGGPRPSPRTLLTHRAADADLSGHSGWKVSNSQRFPFTCFLINVNCKNLYGITFFKQDHVNKWPLNL